MKDSILSIAITWASVLTVWTIAGLAVWTIAGLAVAWPFCRATARRYPKPPAPVSAPPPRPGPVPGYDHHIEDALTVANATTQPMASSGWKVQDCGCQIRLDPPGVLTCPRHAAQQQEVLDLLLWRAEMRTP